MKVSLLIPVYNEEENIELLNEAIKKALSEQEFKYEVVFVDDGSTDQSRYLIEAACDEDPRLKLISFRRNYGQTAALMAAIQHSTGDVFVPLDADLQNDPEDIPLLLEKLEEGYDVVSGWRKDRQDATMTRIIPSKIANAIISSFLRLKLHDYGCSLKVYKRETLENVTLYGEMHRYIPVYAHMEGGRVAEIPVRHHPRVRGVSKYGLGRTVKVMLDILVVYFLTKMMDRPMHFFGRIGLYSMGGGILVGIWALFLKLFSEVSLIQTPLPLLAVFFALVSLLTILIGLLAEVQVRVYYEGRGKPPYGIRSTKNL